MLLIVGEALVAFQRDVTEPPAPYRPPDASGAPAIAAYIAARLGVPTAFVGGVGADDLGVLLRDTLAGAGVTLDALRVWPNRPTATARIDYHADGSRSFDFDVSGTAGAAVAEPALGDLPEQAGWVHVSGSALQFGEPLASTVVAAARRGRAAGATVSFDPNIRAEAMTARSGRLLTEVAALAHVVFPSDAELSALSVTEENLLAAGVLVCRTMGADGCLVRDGPTDVHVPAVLAAGAVVDTDGAGDTFAAAFIAATIAGSAPVYAARIASRVVARAIAVPGPMTVELTPADLVPSPT